MIAIEMQDAGHARNQNKTTLYAQSKRQISLKSPTSWLSTKLRTPISKSPWTIFYNFTYIRRAIYDGFSSKESSSSPFWKFSDVYYMLNGFGTNLDLSRFCMMDWIWYFMQGCKQALMYFVQGHLRKAISSIRCVSLLPDLLWNIWFSRGLSMMHFMVAGSNKTQVHFTHGAISYFPLLEYPLTFSLSFLLCGSA